MHWNIYTADARNLLCLTQGVLKHVGGDFVIVLFIYSSACNFGYFICWLSDLYSVRIILKGCKFGVVKRRQKYWNKNQNLCLFFFNLVSA